ncbi:extracellular solute-binding protein [bacterium]|nr:extracellular solute-binding protein [bacterium]
MISLKFWKAASLKFIFSTLLFITTFVVSLPAVFAREKVELRLWNVPDKSIADPRFVARRRVFEEFCRKHPEIRVKVLSPLAVQEGPAYESNEFLAMAGGVAPDVLTPYVRKIPAYRQQKFCYPLNDYLTRYRKSTGKNFTGIAAPSAAWEPAIDGKSVIAIPQSFYALALKCDKACFARGALAGRAPKDWDELYRYARHMTIDPRKEPDSKPGDRRQYGLSMLTGFSAGWHFIDYVWSGGGEVVRSYYRKNDSLIPTPPPMADYNHLNITISDAATYYPRLQNADETLRKLGVPTGYSAYDLEWRMVTNEPKAMRAFYFYRKLIHQPWMRNGDHEFDITPAMFKSGKAIDPQTGKVFDLKDQAVRKRIYWGVTQAKDNQSGRLGGVNVSYAMEISTLSDADVLDQYKFFVAPIPSYKNEKHVAYVAGDYLAISAGIKAEDKLGRRNVNAIRDAAWKYIEFCTGSEAQRIIAQTLIGYGMGEYVRPSILKEIGYTDLLARQPATMRQLWKDIETNGRVEPYCPGWTNVQTRELNMPIETLINDTPDPNTGKFKYDPQKIMDESVRNVNTMILGKMPDSEVKRRSRIGWGIFAIMALALVWAANKVVKLAMSSQAKVNDNEGFGVGGNKERKRLYAWLFLIPAVGTILIWAYYPLMRGMIMAFQDYKILGGSSFVGLRNFIEAASEPKFWQYLLQTFQYMVMLVGLGFLAPIGLAILLTEIPKGKVLFRTIFYLPAVTTGVVTLFLWKWLIYDPTEYGIINSLILWFNTLPGPLAIFIKLAVLAIGIMITISLLLQSTATTNSKRERWLAGVLGGTLGVIIVGYLGSLLFTGGLHAVSTAFGSKFNFSIQSFLRDPSLAMLWLVIPVIWAGTGPGCLIYLAAMKGIPEEQYEAADLDGAGFWQKVINVMYPNLQALIIINLVGAVVGGFKESTNIFLMTGGGPQDVTMTTGLYIWYNAFMFLNFGLSTAMAWIMGAILLGFTLKQLQILNKIQFRNTSVEQEAKGAKG